MLQPQQLRRDVRGIDRICRQPDDLIRFRKIVQPLGFSLGATIQPDHGGIQRLDILINGHERPTNAIDTDARDVTRINAARPSTSRTVSQMAVHQTLASISAHTGSGRLSV